MKEVLKTIDLTIGYRATPILHALSLSMPAGVVTALIGRNGAGKSTLIKTLTGNIKPLEGDVMIERKPIGTYTKKEMARVMAVVTTDHHMGGGLRLHEFVALGRLPYTGRFGILNKTDRERVEQAMTLTGIIDKRDRFVAELSDGERQKGLIARGMAQDTPIIIMDEPFSYLDVASRLETLELLNRLASEEGKAILFSTHEVTEVLNMVDRAWMITDHGVEEGGTEELIADGAPSRLFPGERVRFDAVSKLFSINR